MAKPAAAKTLKKLAKELLRASRRWYVTTLRSFDIAALKSALRQLGLAPGQALMVHSSFDAFLGFTGKPTDVIAALETLVAPGGTILMPSIPFGGTAIDYVKSGNITDIERTPSRTGILTELFRRQKGTLRSVHPTHPVLARGSRAAAMLKDHRLASTPCGAHSPFAKLLEEKGKILFLGATIDSMTFFHYLEEVFEDRLKPSPFTSEVFEVPVRSGTDTFLLRMRLFDKDMSRRRTITPLVSELNRLGGSVSGRVGTLPLMLVDAVAVRDAFESAIKNGTPLYRSPNGCRPEVGRA
jgi:aminoglycoside 3-N-acetyltransferase